MLMIALSLAALVGLTPFLMSNYGAKGSEEIQRADTVAQAMAAQQKAVVAYCQLATTARCHAPFAGEGVITLAEFQPYLPESMKNTGSTTLLTQLFYSYFDGQYALTFLRSVSGRVDTGNIKGEPLSGEVLSSLIKLAPGAIAGAYMSDQRIHGARTSSFKVKPKDGAGAVPPDGTPIIADVLASNP